MYKWHPFISGLHLFFFSEAFHLPCGMWNNSKLLISVNVSCHWCHVLLVRLTGTDRLFSKINGGTTAKEISLAMSNMPMKTHCGFIPSLVYPFIVISAQMTAILTIVLSQFCWVEILRFIPAYKIAVACIVLRRWNLLDGLFGVSELCPQPSSFCCDVTVSAVQTQHMFSWMIGVAMMQQ